MPVPHGTPRNGNVLLAFHATRCSACQWGPCVGNNGGWKRGEPRPDGRGSPFGQPL